MPRTTEGRTRVALLTHGIHIGGGVPSVARWLTSSLRATGEFDVDVMDLATSSRDVNSRRLTKASTWRRRSLLAACPHGQCHRHSGANAAEVEFMRYHPHRELTAALRDYDLVQVVSGSPAWAAVTRDVNVPVVVQAATTVRWERAATASGGRVLVRGWRHAMTRMTTSVERAAVTGADAVMVENHEMAGHVRALGQPNVHLAPPGVDVDVFRPAGALTEHGYLLSVCRLGDARKGLDRLVRAYQLMTRERPGIPELVVAGRGPVPASLTDLIQRLGLVDRIRVLCDIPADELAELYRGASLFLQTSHEEGLGISVLEAMASGLPVVATTTAGSRETVDDTVTGWLIDQHDEDSLPRRFADRALMAQGPAGRGAGAAGRQRAVGRFSTAATLRTYVEVYRELLTHEHAHAPR